MNAEPIDFAAIQAEHSQHDGQSGGRCLLRGHGIKRADRCDTYRLAAEAERLAGATRLSMRALESALDALHSMSGLPDDVDDFDIICDTVRARLAKAEQVQP